MQRATFTVFHPFDCRCGPCQARRRAVDAQVNEECRDQIQRERARPPEARHR